ENCNAVFPALHQAIKSGLVRACHDLSEGGLAVAAAEMAFAGGLGMMIDLAGVPTDLENSGDTENVLKLFAESNTRFLVEETPENCAAFEQTLGGVTVARVGTITEDDQLVVNNGDKNLLTTPIGQLKEAWQSPLRW
ncbi:MAG: AIR synthase-related protein, partial [Pirellulales bacterium]|nr:AIR synthase-related protein [Pirellulales bacterium]